MDLKNEIINGLKTLPSEIRCGLAERRDEETDDAYNDGYHSCMIKMLDLLIDSKLKETEIISLLQKHFDLRLSEVEDAIRKAKNRRNRNKRHT